MALEQSLEAFSVIKSSMPSIDGEDWTEADARSKFIDSVLIGCLGWREPDIRRELSEGGQRLDYILHTTRPAVIVEAKRPSAAFALPSSSGVERTSLAALLKCAPSLRGAVQQVTEYCLTWGVSFAVLTNGRSYLLFAAVRTDGIPPHKGRCVVIPNVFGERFDFAHLHDLLSKDAILQSRLANELLATRSAAPLVSILDTYADPDAIVGSNAIGLALQPLLEDVFSDITHLDSPEVLKHCYVFPATTALREEEFESLLIQQPPSFARTATVLSIDSRNSFDRFGEAVAYYLGSRSSGQTLLIVGKVGVGKTTFLRRYFTVETATPSDVQQRAVPLFLDFSKPGLDPEQLPPLIYERLRAQMEQLDGRPVPGERNEQYDLLSHDGLHQVFWREVQGLRKRQHPGLSEDRRTEEESAFVSRQFEDDRAFVRGAVRVLRERYHRHVVVILDNADQCAPEYQRAVYLYSRTLEDELSCLVIVALRAEWYWYFGLRGGDGPFSAYHDTVFHIQPPRSRDVIDRRLEYSLSIIRDKLPSVSAPLTSGMMLEAQSLAKYLESCRGAFFQDDEISTFLECVANGDVRKALRVFVEFLRSGHTHVEEYLRAYVQGRDYKLAFHQVFRSVSCGPNRYYSSKRAAIPNLFFPLVETAHDCVSYFASAYLLRFLDTRRARRCEAGDGFVPLADLRAILEGLGLSDSLASELLVEVVKKDLAEPDIPMQGSVPDSNYLRVTAFGRYLVRSLFGRFCYLEATMLDTPLANDVFRASLEKVYTEGEKPPLGARLRAVRSFATHMQQLEVPEQRRVQAAGLTGEVQPLMPTCQVLLAADAERVVQSAAEAGGV